MKMRIGNAAHCVLSPFLTKLPADHEFVVEIRSKTWLDGRLADLLRQHNVALALTDRLGRKVPTILSGQMPTSFELSGSCPVGRRIVHLDSDCKGIIRIRLTVYDAGMGAEIATD